MKIIYLLAESWDEVYRLTTRDAFKEVVKSMTHIKLIKDNARHELRETRGQPQRDTCANQRHQGSNGSALKRIS
jgi:hypothetical protein